MDWTIRISINMLGNKNFVCLNNERIITDKYYFDEKWHDINSGNEISITEDLDKYYNYMKEELDISKSVILYDMLK